MALISKLIEDLVEVRERNSLLRTMTKQCESKQKELEKLKAAFEEAKLLNGQLRDGLLARNLISTTNEALDEAFHNTGASGCGEGADHSKADRPLRFKRVTGRRWNAYILCKGCGKKFQCYRGDGGFGSTKRYEAAFLSHCFDKCQAYKKLNLMRVCRYCEEKKLLTPMSLKVHIGRAHKDKSHLWKEAG